MAGKIFLRIAQASDIERLQKDGVITGPEPQKGESWTQRVVKWLSEQRAGRRVILVAEDATGLLAMLQLVYAFPIGYRDPEAANGIDIAMLENLRMREGTLTEIGSELVNEAQKLAVKRSIKTLTFALPLNNARAIQQARSWGFTEFRVMPEPTKMLAFFRKSIE